MTEFKIGDKVKWERLPKRDDNPFLKKDCKYSVTAVHKIGEVLIRPADQMLIHISKPVIEINPSPNPENPYWYAENFKLVEKRKDLTYGDCLKILAEKE